MVGTVKQFKDTLEEMKAFINMTMKKRSCLHTTYLQETITG